jgi:hypothetical protein
MHFLDEISDCFDAIVTETRLTFAGRFFSEHLRDYSNGI